MFGFRVVFLREGLSRLFLIIFGENRFPWEGAILSTLDVLGQGSTPLQKDQPDELRNSGFNAFRLSFLSPTGFSRKVSDLFPYRSWCSKAF
jgi:hypothetical protein